MSGTMILSTQRPYRQSRGHPAGPALFWFVFTRWAGIALAAGVIAGLALPTGTPTGRDHSAALAQSETTSDTPASASPDPTYPDTPGQAPNRTTPAVEPTAPATTTYAQVLARAWESCSRELESYGKLERQKQRAHAVFDLLDRKGNATADEYASATDAFERVNTRWLDAVSAVGACYENHGAETGDAPVNIQP